MLPTQKKKYDESKNRKDNKHSPLPWKIEERVSQGIFIIGNIPDDYDKTVCIMRWTSPLVPKEFEMADAELIVRAVNSHADLLEELELSLEWLDNLFEAHDKRTIVNSMPNNWNGRIGMRKTIAKAKGE